MALLNLPQRKRRRKKRRKRRKKRSNLSNQSINTENSCSSFLYIPAYMTQLTKTSTDGQNNKPTLAYPSYRATPPELEETNSFTPTTTSTWHPEFRLLKCLPGVLRICMALFCSSTGHSSPYKLSKNIFIG
jgi:hypothetical protein